MAKRFTDTNKYKKPFIRGLQGAYKLFWDYLYHDCDHSGIWIVDFEIAQMYIGSDMKISKENALLYFNQDEIRIIEIDNGKKWFIPSFIIFQYGILSTTNRAHTSVISNLKKHNLLNEDLTIKEFKPLTSPLQGGKDKEKEKEKEQVKEKEGQLEILEQYPFIDFWNLYDKKTGRSDCERKYNKLSLKEKELIFIHLPEYINSTPDKSFRKNPETYLNGKHWNDEIIVKEPKKNNIEQLLEIQQDNTLQDYYKNLEENGIN